MGDVSLDDIGIVSEKAYILGKNNKALAQEIMISHTGSYSTGEQHAADGNSDALYALHTSVAKQPKQAASLPEVQHFLSRCNADLKAAAAGKQSAGIQDFGNPTIAGLANPASQESSEDSKLNKTDLDIDDGCFLSRSRRKLIDRQRKARGVG